MHPTTEAAEGDTPRRVWAAARWWMVAVTLGLSAAHVSAQSSSEARRIFHSNESANIPTTATIPDGQLLVEIAHRFSPPISQGASELWGFDGPVINRLGVSYALSNRAMIGILRSNFRDNLELNGKVRFAEGGGALPWALAAMGGIAWNTQAPEVEGSSDNEVQAYAQLVLDARLGAKVAVGLVPTYLRNPRILDVGQADAFVMGVNGQLYLSRSASLFGEWIAASPREGIEHDAGTFGVELETRGHFFKVLVTNQIRMNPTQFLGGTPYPFKADELRVGFVITRRIPL